MRNPPWDRDELILALDLYFDIEHGQISRTNPRVIELSETLNKLKIHSNIPNEQKFRNPNGVAMKLGNFLRLDPDYEGSGLERGARLEEVIWDQYYNNRDELRRRSNQIKQVLEDDELIAQLRNIEIEDETSLEVNEGKLLSRLHFFRERNQTLVKKKKETELNKSGTIKCEVCGFDFYEVYGELGYGFIECHHTKPISKLSKDDKTTLSDLSLVCSNCHRMLHRKSDLSIQELNDLLK